MLGFWYSEADFRGMIKTGVKEFKIGVESELRKDQLYRNVIERVKTDLIHCSETKTREPRRHNRQII